MAQQSKPNWVLIGMPGSGKSTLGPILAKELGWSFVDTDELIEASHNCSLQELQSMVGLSAFKSIEEDTALSLKCTHTIIATGGSVVYYEDAMKHLSSLGKFIYLKVSLPSLEKRLSNFSSRGVVRQKGQSLESLFDERTPLYEKYAHLIVDCSDKNCSKVCEELLDKL